MTQLHTQKSFDKDLQDIKSKVISMSQMVYRELNESIEALAARDIDRATDTAETDVLIDASERIIDDLIVRSIVLHQPVASDCRQLISALKISRDLERIGDYAKRIARHSTTLDTLDPVGEEQRIVDMGHAVGTMLDEIIQAYENEDVSLARVVRDQDSDVDELYTRIFADLLNINRERCDTSTACTHLSMVARCMERIGDHVTDIAEEILYLVEGEYPEEQRIKNDHSAFTTGND